MSDKYDRAVAYLSKNPGKIFAAWQNPQIYEDLPEDIEQAHCLFQYCTPDGLKAVREDGKVCGCLTQIRCTAHLGDSGFVAWTDALTEEIRKDNSVPTYPDVTSLQKFAEYQRKLDKELARE